jgi:(p)ppGpp synthase/HD superfamily hydrolase
LAARSPERVISVAWGVPAGERQPLYPVDVLVEAADRPGLLRDISEVLAKDKMNVTGVNTQTVKSAQGGMAWKRRDAFIKQRPRNRLCRAAGWRPLGAGARATGRL